MKEAFEGLTGIEFQILTKRKQGRYIALLLGDVEKEMSDDDEFEKVRKLILDYFNDYTRAIWMIAGLEIEGTSYY